MGFFIEDVSVFSPGIMCLALGLSAFIENIFPPVPGDTITAFGAFLVGAGILGFMPVFLSTTIGSLSGFIFLFFIGRYLGRRFFMENSYPFFSSDSIRKAERWFIRYGYFIIALNRFLPGMRSVIAIVSGISILRPRITVLLALVSCAVWNLIWMSIGFMLGNNWEIVKPRLSSILMKYNMSIIVMGSVLLFLYILRKFLRPGR
ncbi:MAG: DedA family protein [Deltaproteobacteria bacterium]|nr:DedA family protein [Deltaproteobacteria bacterium]